MKRLARRFVGLTAAFVLLIAVPAFANGADGGDSGPADASITYTDGSGRVWSCLEWDDTKGCNTGQTWVDNAGKRYTLWLSPDRQHRWWEDAAPQPVAPITAPTPDPEVDPNGAYWCPDGSGPFPPR